MKRFFIIWLSLLCVLCCQAQQRHALIVAIANYPKESGWNSIHSNNDLQILLPQFDRLGFRINTLTDKHATKRTLFKHCNTLLNNLKPEMTSAYTFPVTDNKWKMTTEMKQMSWTKHLSPMMPNPHTKRHL